MVPSKELAEAPPVLTYTLIVILFPGAAVDGAEIYMEAAAKAGSGFMAKIPTIRLKERVRRLSFLKIEAVFI